MAKALLIAEKKSVQNAIANYLQRNPYIDQIDCFQAQGHLIRMAEPNEYNDDWAGKWNYDVLPMIPENMNFKYFPVKGSERLLKLIRDALKTGQYDYIVNACDPDREGEAIFWYIYYFLGCRLPVRRFWCNDMSDDSIEKAIHNFRTYDDGKKPDLTNLKEAAYLRGKMDWLIGMNFSRAASLSMNYLVKVGRVKTVALWFVVDLEHRIQNFKKRTDYRIVLDWYPGKENVECKHVEKEITDKGSEKYTLITYEEKETAEYMQNILNGNKKGTISSIKEEKLRDKPSKLYTLGDIQVDASNRFSISVEESSAIMQALYEAKITTYPRTKNPYLSTTAASALPKMIQACTHIPSLAGFAQEVLNDPSRIDAVKKNSRYVNDKESEKEGHCAITLTGEAFNWSSLSNEQQKVLEMVGQRFLSIFFPDGVDSKTTMILSSNDELFRTSFLNTIDLGYRKIYDEEEMHEVLPNVKEGDSFAFQEARLCEVVASPPKRMNDGALIAAMMSPAKYLKEQNSAMKSVLKETEGIGTEATRMEIIPQLMRDGYLEMKGKGHLLYPTPEGMKIIDNLGDMDITSVDLTAKWEIRLNEIKDGEVEVESVINELLEYVRDNVETLKNGFYEKVGNGPKERVIVGTCPNCGGTIYEGKSVYYCEHYNGQDGPCQFVMRKTIKGAKISLKNMKKIAAGEVSDPVKMTLEKDGAKYKTETRFVYNPETKKIEFYRKKAETVGTCPNCGGNLISTDKYVYCENYKKEDGCKVIFAKNFCGHKFKTEEILSILNGEVSNECQFVNKKGTKFPARLSYNVGECKVDFIFSSAKRNENVGEVGTCPVCGGVMKGPYDGQYGKYYSCDQRCGLNISENQGGYKLNTKELQTLLSGEKTDLITMKSQKGTDYKARLFVNKETRKVEREFDK